MTPDVLFKRAVSALPPATTALHHVARCQRMRVALQCLQRGSLFWRPGRGPSPRIAEA